MNNVSKEKKQIKYREFSGCLICAFNFFRLKKNQENGFACVVTYNL